MRVLFLTSSDERRASSRCRVYQYLPHLAARGIEGDLVSWRPAAAELWRRANTADAVFLQKRVFSVAKLLLLRQRVPRLLFDFDDAIWLRRGSDGAVPPAPLLQRLRLATTLRLADGVVAGNEYLAAYARRWNPHVVILPTPIDGDYYAAGIVGYPPVVPPQDVPCALAGWVTGITSATCGGWSQYWRPWRAATRGCGFGWSARNLTGVLRSGSRISRGLWPMRWRTSGPWTSA